MKTGGVKVSSSPGREQFPAPPVLSRLLYGKAIGSRSRGRTTFVSARSSPIFASRSRNRSRPSSATSAAAVAVEGEPSSPKVTCIGQVRIRSKRKPPANKERSKSSSPPAPCRCLRKVFPMRKKPPGGGGGCRQSLWRKWPCILSGRSGGRNKERKADTVAPQTKLRTFATRALNQEDDGEEGKEKEEEAEAAAAHVVGSKGLPPKNALLLMRCRSAPHNRASSLAAARLAASRLLTPDVPGAPPAEEVEQEPEEQRKPSGAGGAVLTQRREAEAEAVDEWDEARWSESRRPLVLPRSKSEPAARAAAEAPSCFWHRRPSPALVELAH